MAWDELDGAQPLFGNRARYNEGCEAQFTLLGYYLLVGDGLNCSGANVRSNGIYRRAC